MKTQRLQLALDRAKSWKEWRIRKDNEVEEEEQEKRRIERDLDERERVAEEERAREKEQMIAEMNWTYGLCPKCWKDPCECLLVRLEKRIARLSGRGGEE